jgi:hypothetical protein
VNSSLHGFFALAPALNLDLSGLVPKWKIRELGERRARARLRARARARNLADQQPTTNNQQPNPV